jgi:hypothetical protein
MFSLLFNKELPEWSHCRKCRRKLPAITEMEGNAFCCQRCHDLFYKTKCIVCDEPKTKPRGVYCDRWVSYEEGDHGRPVRVVHDCSQKARNNPNVERRYYPSQPVKIDENNDDGSGAYSTCFCPRGWQWHVGCDGLEWELTNGLASVVFYGDRAQWVIKHPRACHLLTFRNRDQALKAAVSLAAATLSLPRMKANEEERSEEEAIRTETADIVCPARG